MVGHGRQKGRTVWVLVALLAGATLVGCGGGPGGGRPATPAILRIASPLPHETTGPDVELRLQLRRARVVSGPGGSDPLRTDVGHLHLWLDGEPLAMAYGLEQPLHALPAGEHLLRAEFVAADHLPFRNRVSDAVTFTVR